MAFSLVLREQKIKRPWFGLGKEQMVAVFEMSGAGRPCRITASSANIAEWDPVRISSEITIYLSLRNALQDPRGMWNPSDDGAYADRADKIRDRLKQQGVTVRGLPRV